MKKKKELLWFLIPFVLLTVWSVFGPLIPLSNPETSLIGENYVKLLMADPTFWVAAGNTLLLYWAVGGVLALVLGLLVCLLRRWVSLSRCLWYVAVFAIATLMAMTVWIAAEWLVPTVYSWLFFMQIGNVAAFFVWLAEAIVTAFKTKKQGVE